MIITTYGTLRSDIQVIIKIKFDYAVLDESQAIKNPASKVTKAACLLNAQNRICMSGTPLQNNTFDIFAQMNFLNPGLLGSMDFFRNEFATPIDKVWRARAKRSFKKIIIPFYSPPYQRAGSQRPAGKNRDHPVLRNGKRTA